MPSDPTIRDLRLREQREERGLTQQDIADQLIRLAWLKAGSRVGVNADMVSKWERGQKRPSKFYRDLLCLLFQTPPDRLGLAPVHRVEHSAGGVAVDAELADSLMGGTSVLDALGAVGKILQPRMFDIWKEEAMKRRTALKLLGLAPAAVASTASLATAGGIPAGAAVPALEELAGKYQQLYHSTKPSHLMTPVLAHLETVADVLHGRVSPAERRQLFQNQSRIATLAGRIAFFDLHDPMGARGYYNLALEAAREAQDALLAAAALGHVAFIPAADHRYTAARDYLTGAAAQLHRRPHALMTSWLSAVEAEMAANAGDERASLTAIDAAQQALGRVGLEPAPIWFDYYDATRLDGFAGYANLRFRRFAEATRALDSAAAALPAGAVKQRAVILTDLATVHLHAGELDRACQIAAQATDLLGRADYATGTDRLREFRALLCPWNNHPAVQDFDERLALI
jgi:transcriptional regulator with XRE-family HTH domain